MNPVSSSLQEEAYANAHLIETAPDLYDALNIILATENISISNRKLGNRVLAKARGE